MSTRTDIPGGSIELKDSAELTNKEVKRLRRAARAVGSIQNTLDELGYDAENADTQKVIFKLSDEDLESVDLFQRECVVVRLMSWSFDRPLPTNVDEVDDLPRTLYGPVTVAASAVSLGDDFTIEAAVDPKADTTSSDSSEPPLVVASS